MLDIYTENAIFNYYIVSAISGGNVDGRKVILAIGDIFCKSADESERLYEITESDSVKEVSTVAEYNRYKRTEQYCRLCNIDAEIPEDEKAVTDIKGAALIAASASKLISLEATTVNGTVSALMNEAETGRIVALRLLGFLQCEGFLVKKNLQSGIKNLLKAAKWGDVPSALALMKYSEKTRAEACEILAAAVKNTPCENLPAVIAMRYGVEGKRPSEETELIKKAFAQKKIDPENYDPMYARLIFSEVLSLKDKERIIFSGSKQTLSEACDLPLKLKTHVEPKTFCNLPDLALSREKERAAVTECLNNYRYGGKGGGLPLCLCSESTYVLNMYAESISALFCGANIERIEIADLLPCDTEPTKNDLFVRSINETKHNVFILSFKGETCEAAAEWAKKIIRDDFRKKYRLIAPAVSLDLSAVSVIVLADAENAKRISKYTETVNLARVKEGEKQIIVKAVADKKGKDYGYDSVTIDEDALTDLCAINAEKAEKILEKIIRNDRSGKKQANVSRDNVHRFLKQKDFNNTYGFGGKINEDV